jgi:thiol-disulfide isomerase/thioredoxin
MRNTRITAALLAIGLAGIASAHPGHGESGKTPGEEPRIEVIDGKLHVNGAPVEGLDGVVPDGAVITFGEPPEIQQLPAAPEGVLRHEAWIPPEKLPMPHSLPKTYLLDARTGDQVDIASFEGPLGDLLREPQFAVSLVSVTPSEGRSALETVLADTLVDGGQPIPTELWGDARYVLVQWWADWCAPCLKEAKLLGELFARAPMPEVVWIAVEADPMRGGVQAASAAMDDAGER